MIRFVVALPAEARPLIEHYRLSRRAHTPFPVYENGTAALIVSGVGRAKAAEATSCLRALTGRGAAWLNVGIAGHGERALGEAVLAHRIRDHASTCNWYPPMLFHAPCASASVLTVEQPLPDYPEDWLVDMEAAGFYEAACGIVTAELVQVLKVVSDNVLHPTTQVRAKAVERLIGDALPVTDALVASLDELGSALPSAPIDEGALAPFLGRWHFTVSERYQLRRLLERWRVLAPEQDLWSEALTHAGHAGEVLRRLERELRSLPVCLGSTR